MLSHTLMSRITLSFPLVLLILCAVTFAQQKPIPEGAKPYTPTRAEWLALELEAQLRVSISHSDYSMDFVSPAGTDTVVILVAYMPDVDRVVMNKAIDVARNVIDLKSKGRGWSS